MKKDTILILIAVAAILALVLPKPAGMIIPLMILIPVVIYLIVDIIKNGNNDKKWKTQFNVIKIRYLGASCIIKNVDVENWKYLRVQ